MTIAQIPPYGFINSEWLDGVSNNIPPNFVLGGGPVTVDQYRAWVAALAHDISEHLWPVFDLNAGVWRGSATESAIALTVADFNLLDQLRVSLPKPIHARGPGETHRYFFNEEDGFTIDSSGATPRFAPVGWSYGKYDNLLPATIVDKVRRAFAREGIHASGELDIQLKQLLLRPRAYQVAMIFGRSSYDYQWAKSAVSPSLVSGHSLQASIAGCRAYLDCAADLATVPDAARYWAQFTVDMGDRRVFAGVHYPSDNISSWFCALRLARHIFGPQSDAARRFLWDAITQCSAVYTAITTASRTDPYSPYITPLQWLTSEDP
jgi:hypothetical protein